MMRTTMYLHGSKYHNAQKAKELGLEGEAFLKFLYALQEVKLEVEVEPDGSTEIITVDDRRVAP